MLTTKEFIKRSKKIHNEKYDYSLVEYKGMLKNIKIICKTHGVFEQKPREHLKGSGCQQCNKWRKNTKERFIEKANKVHNNFYDYSLVNYKKGKEKIKIICPEHGVFEQIAESHLRGTGCPACAHTKRRLLQSLTTEEFIHKAKEIYPMYDYTKVKYINSETKVEIICPEHGKFLKRPSDLIHGYCGCPSCSKTGFNPSKPGIIYYIQDLKTGLYKIGITNKTVKARFSTIKNIRVIWTMYFEKGSDALYLEQEILKKYKDKRINNKEWLSFKGGKTEFFKEDILKNILEDFKKEDNAYI